MRTGFMRKIVSAITVAGVALTGVLTSAMAAAAQPEQLKGYGVNFDLDAYVGHDPDTKYYGTEIPHDGIDAYDESFLKETAPWYGIDEGSNLWRGNVFQIAYDSEVKLSLSEDAQGELLWASPMVFAFDDDGHIAYVVENSASDVEITNEPKTVIKFNNVNPLEMVSGSNAWFEQYAGKIQPEKLLFCIAIYKGQMQDEFVGLVNFMIKEDGASSSDKDTHKTITAKPTASKVLVDGKEIAFDAYEINGNNYFKLRDISSVLNGTSKQFEVSWDNEKQAINLLSSKAYTAVGGELAKGDGSNKAATPNTSKIYLDGKEISLTAYTINDNNYFKLRDLGQTFDFGVGWDGAANTVTIDTSAGYTAE